VLGGAALIVLALLGGQDRVAAVLYPALLSLLVVHGLVAVLFLHELWSAPGSEFRRREFVRDGALAVAGGTLFPLILMLATGHVYAIVLAAALIFVGSLAMRFLIVRLPLPTP
jgi:hypothetical protein